jgi:tRNA G18 (ribose-2'-O)-methylase SpoU
MSASQKYPFLLVKMLKRSFRKKGFFMNKNKCFTALSEKKWQTFDIKKKIKAFRDLFLEIEQSIYTPDIQAHVESLFELLEFETEPTLKQLYNAFQTTKNAPLTDLYHALRPIFNESLTNQKDFHFLKINTQDKPKDTPKLPLILILDNLRSAFNVGSIIRTAECLNIESIYFCGYTPQPDHPKVKNTAMGTQEKINWQYFEQTEQAVSKAKENEYQVIALETVESAVSIYEYEFPSKTALILGNEALGISNEILNLCDNCVALPILGWKNSLNVATACAVACFEIHRQR